MSSSRLQKVLEIQMHLEHARRLLDELAMETFKEEARLKEEEDKKKKEEENEKKREILPHFMVRPVCKVIPEVRTPPQPQPQPRVAFPRTENGEQELERQREEWEPQRVEHHPRVFQRIRLREQAFRIPETEDWESEATQPPSALPITNVNWEHDWSRRCVCGARPGRCQH